MALFPAHRDQKPLGPKNPFTFNTRVTREEHSIQYQPVYSPCGLLVFGLVLALAEVGNDLVDVLV